MKYVLESRSVDNRLVSKLMEEGQSPIVDPPSPPSLEESSQLADVVSAALVSIQEPWELNVKLECDPYEEDERF